MYSPFQEVPSTPALLSRTNTLKRFAGTPEAVVPEVRISQSQGESVSVPGTPVSSAVQSSPWTPNVRSLTRTQKGRRYTYNPSLAPRFVSKSPAAVASPREQVVPSTPAGGYHFPHTPKAGRVCKMQFVTPNRESGGDSVDAAGDRLKKSNAIKNEEKNYNYKKATPHLRPRSQREIVAGYRRSPEATRGSGESAVTNDFLDLI